MHRSLSLVAVGVVALAGAVAGAQSKPDFSGTWIIVTPAEAAGQEQQVQQTATTLTTGHASEGGGHAMTYKLDGTETRNVLTSHGEDIVSLSKAAWDGNKLVITTVTTYPDGRKLDAKQIWSLNAEGALVVEHTQAMAELKPTRLTVVHRKR
jgi:hypothetical protein